MNHAELARAVAHGQRDFWNKDVPCTIVGWHMDDGACVIIEELTPLGNDFEYTGVIRYVEADDLEPMEKESPK